MSISRRVFLRGAAAGAAACALPLRLQAQEAYGGFPMGLQTYTLRDFNFDQTLGHLKDLGLKYAQFFSKQLPITDDKPKIHNSKAKIHPPAAPTPSSRPQGFTHT